jgi:hypothetical protein
MLSEDCAVKIARDCNVPASGSGYVTCFQMWHSFLNTYAAQNAGGLAHSEYGSPAEEMAAFNKAIIGEIEDRGHG